MDCAALKMIANLAARICSLSDIDAAQATLVAQGKSPIKAGHELARICQPGARADRLAATLDDPYMAARYVQKIASAFAPFAEILHAIEVTGDGETWTQDANGGYTKRQAARWKWAQQEIVEAD